MPAPSPDQDAHSRLLVVKLGSSSVTRAEGPDTAILEGALAQVVEANRRGWRVVLVTSGAQSIGRAVLGDPGATPVSDKLAAAFGQPVLMDFYRQHAALLDARVCQVLVGDSDLRSQQRVSAIGEVLLEALQQGIIPIVNGNDPADDTKTNNDLVAAGIARMIQASHLLLLTDVDGVYAGSIAAGSQLPELAVSEVHRVRSVGTASGKGTGGIRSKLRAAELTARSGIETRIASAKDPEVIAHLTAGRAVGTVITAPAVPTGSTARKWVAGGATAQGALTINGEAEQSIMAGSSLFASGVKSVKGAFAGGDVVELLSPQGRLLGRGRVRLSSGLLTLVRSLRVEEIAAVLVALLGRPDLAVLVDADDDGRAAGTGRLALALDRIDRLGDRQRRDLQLEVIALFPDDAARALTDRAPQDRFDLIAHYTSLAAGLRVVHNDYLVEFAVDGQPQPGLPSPA